MSLANNGLRQPGLRQFCDPNAGGGITDLSSLNSAGQWHVWGRPVFDLNSIAADTAAGVNPVAGNDHLMWAIPMLCPETIRITALAMGVSIAGGGGTGVPIGGEHGWIGIARDSIVSANHWPGATVAGSAVQVIGTGGARKLRGGAVAVTCGPNEIVWQVGQVQINSVAGAAIYGMPMGNWTEWGGLDDLRGLAIGDDMPGSITTARLHHRSQLPRDRPAPAIDERRRGAR
jgi:hypothetical protein